MLTLELTLRKAARIRNYLWEPVSSNTDDSQSGTSFYFWGCCGNVLLDAELQSVLLAILRSVGIFPDMLPRDRMLDDIEYRSHVKARFTY